MCSYLLVISYLNLVICDDMTEKHCGLTPWFNGTMLVAPPDGFTVAVIILTGMRVIYLHILIDFRH